MIILINMMSANGKKVSKLFTKKILKLLIDNGLSQADIARTLGVTRGMVNHVVHDRDRSDRVARAIAHAVKRPVAELFPYIPNPKRLKKAA